ncbi:MAG: hypothetical protein HS111_34330 [Kofleriaceae bacterium]|nr:hypothetical protein [Kofleriaceae bacterium]MCL4225037.1 hypothetical protein [Myxococcales bacterium]
MSREHRRARRVAVNLPAVVESIGQPEVTLHPAVAAVYRRVDPDVSALGRTQPGFIRDLSTNGAFIGCEPLPLLSRVRVGFELPSYGAVEAVGWVLWGREADCEVPDALGDPVPLPRGIGVLFEAMPLEARQIVARMAR